MGRPLLDVRSILKWADAHHRRLKRWPTAYSGRIYGAMDETWRRVDSALRLGLRGLPGGSSLSRLLEEERGVRNLGHLPNFTIQQILTWADIYFRRHKSWPTTESGPIPEAPGEKWKAVDYALRVGRRGLPGGSSLAQLLETRRGVRNIQALRKLTEKQILIWADTFHHHTGQWPTPKSGRIPYAPGETWSGVNAALRSGRRGFPGGYSLPRLLAAHRGVRNPKQPPLLSEEEILAWAKAHQRRTGAWPTRESGPIKEVPGETWMMIDRALRTRKRGLRRRISLFRLLKEYLGKGKPTGRKRVAKR